MDVKARMAIGIMGGTFDPVHNAHLQMALEAQRNLGLDSVRLVPCHRPPHRDCPSLCSEQRLHLLTLATEDSDVIEVDDRELQRNKASYTVDTLLSLREELGDEVSLVFLLGMDAFSHLTSWYKWEKLRALTHIAVMTRPNSPAPKDGVLADWLANIDSPSIVHQQAAGGLLLLEQSLLPISATAIREQLLHSKSVDDLPPKVAEYLASINE